jgi:hypothetical protein
MDDRRFDAIARNLASGTSRRALLAGLLGLGGIAAAGIDRHHAGAARRGFRAPRFLPATQCSSDYDCGGDAVCCVGDCCSPGQSCVTTPNNTSYCA